MPTGTPVSCLSTKTFLWEVVLARVTAAEVQPVGRATHKTRYSASNRGWLAMVVGCGPRASGLAAEFQVFPVGLFENLTKCSDFGAVFGFQSGYFGGDRGDDVVVGCGLGGGLLRRGSVLAPLVFDPCTGHGNVTGSTKRVDEVATAPAPSWSNETGNWQRLAAKRIHLAAAT